MAENPVLSDEEVARLLAAEKPITDRDWRTSLLPGRREQMTLRGRLDLGELPATSPLRGRLHVYSRQNLNPAVEGDWSVGLIYTDYADRSYRLVRCNGPHPNDHQNRIEGDVIQRTPHVHVLTERYQRLRRPTQDGFAFPTDAYDTIEGALEHLASIATLVPEGRLFL